MNDTRARFEEIWPVPEGIGWLSNVGRYVQITGKWLPMGAAQAYNARLDTFTRCQETTDVYVSLIQEMIDEIMSPFDTEYDGEDWCNRAKQIMEQKK